MEGHELMRRHVGRQEGSALLAALVAAVLLAALGLSLVSVTMVEGMIAANHRAGNQVSYAAEAVLEAVLADLLTAASWTDILNGTIASSLNSGTVPPAGPGQAPLDLTRLTQGIQTASDARGQWGANQPRWRLFGRGTLSSLAPAYWP